MFEEWSNLLYHKLCSENIRERFRRDFEAEDFAIGGQKSKHLLLLSFLILTLLEPTLRSNKGWFLLFSLGHISPRGTKLGEPRLQLPRIPSEVLKITNCLKIASPIRSIPRRILLGKLETLLHESRTRIIFTDLPLWLITLSS